MRCAGCRCPARPANVLPIGFSASSTSRGRGWIQTKSLRRIPAYDLARSFLSKKRLPSCKGMHSDTPLEPVTMTRVACLIEECLQAGKCAVLNDGHLTDSPYTEGDGQNPRKKDDTRDTTMRSLVTHDDPPRQDEKEKLAMLNQATALLCSVESFCHLHRQKDLDPEVLRKSIIAKDLLSEFVWSKRTPETAGEVSSITDPPCLQQQQYPAP